MGYERSRLENDMTTITVDIRDAEDSPQGRLPTNVRPAS
jgi:hypothetical protein